MKDVLKIALGVVLGVLILYLGYRIVTYESPYDKCVDACVEGFVSITHAHGFSVDTESLDKFIEGCDESCGGVHKQKSTPTPVPTHSVKYEVTGSGTSEASVSWEDPEAYGPKMDIVSLPWEKTYTFEEGWVLSLSAKNMTTEGTVTCRIWVDGKKRREQTSLSREDPKSTEMFVTVSCSGVVVSD